MNRYFIQLIFLLCSATLLTAQSQLIVNLNGSDSDSYIINDVSHIKIVSNVVNVVSVEIDNDKVEMKAGETYQVGYSITPENATNNSVTWSSSMNSIATVDANGLVTAVSDGTTIISVETEDGGFKDELSVVVSPTTSVEIYEKDIKIYPNPIQSTLFIELGDITKYEVIISDINGNVMHSQYDENEIDLRNYPAGNYFLTLIINNKYYNFKLIKN